MVNKTFKEKWSVFRNYKWSGLREIYESRYRFIRNRFFLTKDDVYLASFPRSGNTWMRNLLSDIFLQISGYQTSTVLPIHHDFIVPDIYKHDLRKIDPRIKLPFRTLKTHERYDRRTRRTIYLFRQPEDTLCSYYYFHRRFEEDWYQNGALIKLDEFCIAHADTWRENVESYIAGKEAQSDRILMVSYETLHRRPEDILAAIAKYLGLAADKDMISRAVENHRFEKHHPPESSREKIPERSYSKGKIGAAKEQLRSETLAFIREKTKAVYDKALRFEAA